MNKKEWQKFNSIRFNVVTTLPDKTKVEKVFKKHFKVKVKYGKDFIICKEGPIYILSK